MFHRMAISLATVLVVGTLLTEASAMVDKTTVKGGASPVRIQLLGASISARWKLDEFPQRVGDASFGVTAVQEYDFDKSQLLHDALKQGARPDAIVIKECAAYFPGDLDQYKKKVAQWAGEAKRAGIRPILATTVPVTEELPTWFYVKKLVKRYILMRDVVDNSARLKEIWEYNDWVRRYGAENGFVVLDLERAVRISDKNRALRTDLHDGDGLHLNDDGYRALDTELLATLRGIYTYRKTGS